MTFRSDGWRPFFAIAAVSIVYAGMNHPRGGSMEAMLADPGWVSSHIVFLGGIVALLFGLVLYRRAYALPVRTRRWALFAIVGAALQAVELAFHTASVVDYENLVAGAATPVLTIHLMLAMVLYPVFGVAVAGFIFAGARDRVLGSAWFAWVGILGALAHGAAPPVVSMGVPGAAILFPMVMFLAIWLILAALWPVRVPDRTASAGAAPSPLVPAPADAAVG